MNQSWIDASHINRDTRQGNRAVDFTAHPLLDPDFATNGSRLLYLIRMTFRRILRSDEAYRRELARLFEPTFSDMDHAPDLQRLQQQAAEYLREADVYLAATIDLLPETSRNAVLPQALINDCLDVRDLLGISIHGDTGRLRYEARRKLALALYLLQIDQSRSIQDGPAHKTQFEQILNRAIWSHTKQIHDVQVGFRMDPSNGSIKYSSRVAPGDTEWNFRSTFIEKQRNGRSVALDILYYNCRFKRSVTPISYEVVDGTRRVTESARWGEMRQETSGSILSKMIRKGVNNPEEIGDIIGAMFIVNDNDALTDLLVLLDSCIGTPFGWRNVTDLLSKTPGGVPLNSYSSKDYKVFKGDIDVLYQDEGGGAPYRFPVEVQIYTLESYLRTVCGAHDANHLALKLRQFLFGLAPKIFPGKIYGEAWLELNWDL